MNTFSAWLRSEPVRISDKPNLWVGQGNISGNIDERELDLPVIPRFELHRAYLFTRGFKRLLLLITRLMDEEFQFQIFWHNPLMANKRVQSLELTWGIPGPYVDLMEIPEVRNAVETELLKYPLTFRSIVLAKVVRQLVWEAYPLLANLHYLADNRSDVGSGRLTISYSPQVEGILDGKPWGHLGGIAMSRRFVSEMSTLFIGVDIPGYDRLAGKIAPDYGGNPFQHYLGEDDEDFDDDDDDDSGVIA